MSAKRSSTLSGETAQAKLRGRETFERENSYCHDRDLEKRQRESAAKLAREEAAERSRVATREWAEKKRRREQALKETMRAGARGIVGDV